MEIITLLKKIKSEYEENANAEIALRMKAYMKDKFEFYGLKKPIRTQILKKYNEEFKNRSVEEQVKAVKWLWKQKEREIQYLAFDILFKNKKFWTEDVLELLEELIITNSWWDSVDYIASTLIGYYFMKWPKNKIKKAREWSQHKNMWLNRTAIIFQLKYYENTDVDLLIEVILPHLESKEFFIQKAIGWSLRQYAYTDYKMVKRFVETNPLKPLSVREALKHL